MGKFEKTLDGKWYKFNDEIVDVAEPEDVFESNFGGFHTEAKLNQGRNIIIVLNE